MEGTKLLSFKEPIHEIELHVWSIPILTLENSPYQRKMSTDIRNKLASSLTVGMLGMLTVVQVDGQWLVVDGQHRRSAFIKAKGNAEVICLEIPAEFRYHALLFNIEKADQIKDSCLKVYHMYEDLAEKNPERTEKWLQQYLLGKPYYASLAYAYVMNELSSPSLVETAVKKFDDWLELPLSEAIHVRRNRGEAIAYLAKTVNEVAERDGLIGQGSHLLKSSIMSKTTMALWGRAKRTDNGFDQAIQAMLEHILQNDWSWLGGPK